MVLTARLMAHIMPQQLKALLRDRHDLQTDSYYSCVNVVKFVNASNDYWWLLAQLGVGSGETSVTVQTGNI